MGKIKSFEDLEVWQLSMSLCTEIYELTNTDLFSKDFGLKEQIRRSAISIPSNISEGKNLKINKVLMEIQFAICNL